MDETSAGTNRGRPFSNERPGRFARTGRERLHHDGALVAETGTSSGTGAVGTGRSAFFWRDCSRELWRGSGASSHLIGPGDPAAGPRSAFIQFWQLYLRRSVLS